MLDPDAYTGSSSLHTVNPEASCIQSEGRASAEQMPGSAGHENMAFSGDDGNLEKELHGQSAFIMSHFVVLFVRVQLRNSESHLWLLLFMPQQSRRAILLARFLPRTYGTCGKSHGQR